MAQSWDGQFAAVADNECGVLIGLTSWFNEINAKYGEGTADKLTMIPITLERTIRSTSPPAHSSIFQRVGKI